MLYVYLNVAFKSSILEVLMFKFRLFMKSFFSRSKAKELIAKGVLVIPVIIGDAVIPGDVEPTTDNPDIIVVCPPGETPSTIGTKIDKAIIDVLNGEFVEESLFMLFCSFFSFDNFITSVRL